MLDFVGRSLLRHVARAREGARPTGALLVSVAPFTLPHEPMAPYRARSCGMANNPASSPLAVYRRASRIGHAVGLRGSVACSPLAAYRSTPVLHMGYTVGYCGYVQAKLIGHTHVLHSDHTMDTPFVNVSALAWPRSVGVASLSGRGLAPWMWPRSVGVASLRRCGLASWVWPHSVCVASLRGCGLAPWVWPRLVGAASLRGCGLALRVWPRSVGVASP